MDATLQKALLDRVYEKRKAATLELEKLAREALAKNDRAKINLFIQQLCSLLESNPSTSSNPQSVNARNGGLIGIAGIGIALGVEIAAYLEQIVPPVLACFVDPDSKIRYFACESFYNIAKVCKGEILMYFNEIFDALSKLAADTELSVKNGAELLDRLLKDIVCETAPNYISQYQDIPLIRARQDAQEGNVGGQAELDVAREKIAQASQDADTAANKAFSLARFVPLLVERIYVLSPFTRNYLVSWITVLDSVPDLELVTYLPQFLDGLLKYLSDPNTDVRVETAKVLADFLREIQEAAEVARIRKETIERSGDVSWASERQQGKEASKDSDPVDQDGKADGTTTAVEEDWLPAQEVRIDYVAIMEILLNHIAYPDEEIQATTQQWIAELLNVLKEVVIPFTPRIIPAILPNIAHHSPAIQVAANALNVGLYQVIEEMEWAGSSNLAKEEVESTGSPRNSTETTHSLDKRRVVSSPPTSPRLRPIVETQTGTNIGGALGLDVPKPNVESTDASDPFSLQATVNVLTLQLIDEHEETRVSALEWLLMLHHKAPRRILSIDDGTFPALLKTLSDPSEEVVRCDLRLLAQMSGASDDAYNSYLANLVNLFSTDRRLLEARGSLIVRQLCTTLPTERVFRTLAEILEKDEDLEFASIMVINLNMILLTSPELGDFRKRLKNLDTKDGQNLFLSLYRSWCHNAVASLTLCLLAQAYEHAANLLSIFPDLEISVPFLIQIDKLVQLLESPVFMMLRLQLLEPERYPHLLKTLYGLLMLLPQSSAFATLRNRLNAVSALGYLHVGSARGGLSPSNASSGGPSTSAATAQSGSNVSSTRSKIASSNRDELKWNEMLIHFKVVQGRHERARRAANALDENGHGDADTTSMPGGGGGRQAITMSRQGSGGASTSKSNGATKRLGAALGLGIASGSSAVRSSSVGSSRGRNDGTTDRVSGSGTSGSTSFFRLPIGPSNGGGAAPRNANNSASSQATVAARPTSPPVARRSGATTGAVPGLISRTMSLNQSQRNR
jgi:vacuole morphology and inheritance protein 14